jgi:PRC-barrel domain
MHRLVQVVAVVGALLISRPFMAEALPANAAPCQATVDTWRLAQSADRPAATATQAPSAETGQEAPSITGDGTPATVIDDREVEGILGKSVRSSAGEDMGKIIDVIVKRDGQVRAAVIDFGGFLGVGSRKIAVDWGALSFPPNGAVDHVFLNLTRDQVRLAPEYRPGEPVVVLGAASPEQTKPENPPQPENTLPEK